MGEALRRGGMIAMKVKVKGMGTALVLTLGLLPIGSGCAAIPKEAKIELAKPVDCATAPEDLRNLKSEKASVEKQFFDGVTAVTPAGAVLGILTMTEKDKLEVAIGDYNHRINRKIEEIQTTCGIR
jgi:hypothetical protein